MAMEEKKDEIKNGSNGSFLPWSFVVILLIIISYYLGSQGNLKVLEKTSPTPTLTKIEEKKEDKKEQESNQEQQQEASIQNQQVQQSIPSESPITIPTPKIYKQGYLDIKPNKKADLDEGLIVDSANADISLEINGPAARYLAPLNGASIDNVGKTSPGRDLCKTKVLTNIKWSIEDFPSGTFVCYLTNGNRYGELKVLQDVKIAGMLKIYMTTWE